MRYATSLSLMPSTVPSTRAVLPARRQALPPPLRGVATPSSRSVRCRRLRLVATVRTRVRRYGWAVEKAAASAADVMRAKYALLDCARWVAGGGSSDEAAKAKLPSLVDALKELVPPAEAKPADMALRGSNWGLVYSDSKGPSGGKVGPFKAVVEQRFAKDTDSLVNSAQLGPLKAALNVKYDKVNDTRLRVTFDTNEFSLFGLKKESASNAGRQGHWEIAFADDTLRVMYTNAGSLFVLEPIA